MYSLESPQYLLFLLSVLALLLSFTTWPSLYLPPKLICISQASLSSSTNFLVKNMDQRETLILGS